MAKYFGGDGPPSAEQAKAAFAELARKLDALEKAKKKKTNSGKQDGGRDID